MDRLRIAIGTRPTASNRPKADPNYLYATGWYGSILRVNKITGQTQHIFERTPKMHESGSAADGILPPFDSQTFYLATQYLLATHDKGMHWEAASPDLTATAGGEAERSGRTRWACGLSPKDAKLRCGRARATARFN